MKFTIQYLGHFRYVFGLPVAKGSVSVGMQSPLSVASLSFRGFSDKVGPV